ncbi:hypothetical protein E6W39_12900 [Kitasatospora acidiphila]|uniref:Uncharacterized protein n=1 Tax=Kitasatospora acidiphila TaxID=2567942 RepID=A0A540W1U2_9ACTN|nr:hypothetical protein [Kitasatospora acidiphila]TQF02995.1 hypothetical protein E6W39_12900 [Kitasatospora acidiphila]
MNTTAVSSHDQRRFLERFSCFEDGVITGIRLHIPRGPSAGWTASFDIQAMDGAAGNDWRLVQITVGGVYEYEFPCSRQYSYFVLSDGLKLDCTDERCVLDLDPGPDEWLATQVGQQGEYSKQYVIGTSCEYEVLSGPFI